MNTEATIFAAAAALPEEERAAYLEEACAGQPEFRLQVEALLRSNEVTGFMTERRGRSVAPSAAGEQHGDRLGHYRLLEQIGEGGFGTVWVAEQEKPVRRRVALKIIKPGMDSREIIARFGQERQALAMMDHPAIAKVFDAGTTDKGRPYFVMELVRGTKITAFCDDAKLPTAARLQLFTTVCQAVQHAHQKGIIHRDLKPSNILVTPGDDGLPLPKVIDFGVAKAMQQSLSDDTVYTQFEQLIGTPAYMSPEQAGLGPMDIDTRSDVYSLGVLLYELLAGRPPFDPRELLQAGPDEMRRIIREVEPQRPSTRVSTMERAALAALAGSRQAAPPKLLSTLRGELDWIVMKALEKDRRRRYETANDLAADIQSFLRHETVSAGPPSKTYRLRKFIRRNRRPVIAGALIFATLVAGIAGTGLGLFRARKERDVAQSHLYDSLLREASATQLARIDGYRPKVFSLLQKAGQLGIKGKNPDEIRQQVINCLGDFVGLPPVSIDGTPSKITAIALHPQQPLLAAGLATGSIRIYDFETGSEHAELTGHRASVGKLVFDDNGELTSVDVAETALTWRPSGAREWISRPAENSEALKTDPNLFPAQGLTDQAAYESTKGKLLATAASRFGPIKSMAFDSAAGLLAAGCDEGLMVFELPGLQQRMSVRSDSQTALAFHPHRPLLATGSIRGQVRLWNQATNREEAVMEFSGGGGSVSLLTFRRDGNYLAAAKDNSIRVWKTGGTEERMLLAGHAGGVTCSAFSPDGARLATGGKDRTVKIWDRVSGALVRKIDSFHHYVQTVDFHPGGRLLATGDYAGRVLIWDWQSGRIVARCFQGGADVREIYRVAFSPDGRYLAATSDGLSLWRLPEPPELTAAEGEGGESLLEPVTRVPGARSLTLCFSADSSLVAWVDQNSRIRIWDIAASNSRPFAGPNVLRGWQSLAFVPQTTCLAYVSHRQLVQGWDAASDRSVFTLGNPGSFPGWHISVSPDGKWLLGEAGGMAPVIWNLVTRKQLLRLPETPSSVWTLAWCPQSDGIAIGLADGSTSIWSFQKIRANLDRLGLGWPDEELNTPASPSSGDLPDSGTPDATDSLAKTGSPENSSAGSRNETIRTKEEGLVTIRNLKGPRHLETLYAIGGLAASYAEAGRWDESCKLLEEELAICREVLGPEHPETLRVLNNLAPSYPRLGRLPEALAMGEELVGVRRRVLGPEHPDTLNALNNLTTFYLDAGRLEDAFKAGEELLRLRQKVNGPGHADTFKAMANLANTCNALGRWDEAVKLAQDALTLSRSVNGPEHPDTLTAMGTLARTYAFIGRADEAVQLREDRLALSRRVNGPRHPDTIDAMQDLASRYDSTGREDEALKLREEVFRLSREVHGPDRPSTLAAMTNLAISYRKANLLEKAIPLQEEALERKKKTLHPGHQWIYNAMTNLAACYAAVNRPQEAEKLKLEAQELKLRYSKPVRKSGGASEKPPAPAAPAPADAQRSSEPARAD